MTAKPTEEQVGRANAWIAQQDNVGILIALPAFAEAKAALASLLAEERERVLEEASRKADEYAEAGIGPFSIGSAIRALKERT